MIGRSALPLLLPLLLPACGDDGGDPPAPDAGATPDAASAPATVGAACASAKACGVHLGTPLSCIKSHNGVTWSGGYCTLPCDKSKPSCPLESTCEREPIYTALDEAHCFKECTTNNDCRAGYWCSGSSYVCYPKARP
jgi:hypothetical protein